MTINKPLHTTTRVLIIRYCSVRCVVDMRYPIFFFFVLHVSTIQCNEGNEAICPPARFISCGSPPPHACAVGMATCCWVSNGTGVNTAWGSTYMDESVGEVSSANFGVPDGAPVAELTFNIFTYELTGLKCHYYSTSVCGGGIGSSLTATLESRDPARYQIPPVMAHVALLETTPNNEKYACNCSNKDALPLPERYRCCYWQGRPDGDTTRALTCSIPRADPVFVAGRDCVRTTRPVANCGDSGGCYCRFAYNALSSSITREDWDCGRCCPDLTGDFGRDLTQRHNNTMVNCLSTAFPLALPDAPGCEVARLDVREVLPLASGTGRLTWGSVWMALLLAWREMTQ